MALYRLFIRLLLVFHQLGQVYYLESYKVNKALISKAIVIVIINCKILIVSRTVVPIFYDIMPYTILPWNFYGIARADVEI